LVKSLKTGREFFSIIGEEEFAAARRHHMQGVFAE
jgi:hypothetical protein